MQKVAVRSRIDHSPLYSCLNLPLYSCSVSNTVKRAWMIWLSVLVFANPVNWLSGLGTSLVLGGVLIYFRELTRERRAHGSPMAGSPMAGSHGAPSSPRLGKSMGYSAGQSMGHAKDSSPRFLFADGDLSSPFTTDGSLSPPNQSGQTSTNHLHIELSAQSDPQPRTDVLHALPPSLQQSMAYT